MRKTRRKRSARLYLDGKVSCVVGTHTHVQTADEKILPKGTAYITDLGMCGPTKSVIGSDPALSIARSISQMPLKSEIADTPPMLQGVIVRIDPITGKALSIERFTRCFSV